MPAIATGRVINGNIYSYSSITIAIAGTPYTGVTEISYSDNLEPGELYGTGPYILGLSRGKYKADASFTMAKKDFESVKRALVATGGGGFGEAPFVITVAYRETFDVDIISDTVEGCRIMKQENSHSSGSADPLVVKVDLSVFRIAWNGLYAVSEPGQSVLIGL